MAKRGKRHKGLLKKRLDAIRTAKPHLETSSRKKSADELRQAQQQARQAHLNGTTKQACSLKKEKHKGSYMKDFS